MLENYVRTDLALELKEDISEKNDIAGVRVETYENTDGPRHTSVCSIRQGQRSSENRSEII